MLDRKRLGHLKELAIRLNDKEYLQLIEQSERAIDLDERNLKEQNRIIEIAKSRLIEIRRLQDENKHYQEALGFYANGINYKPMHYDLNVDKFLSKIDYDEGSKAREALEEPK